MSIWRWFNYRQIKYLNDLIWIIEIFRIIGKMFPTGRSYEATQIIMWESCELQASFGAVFLFRENQRSTKTFIKIKSKSYNRFREVSSLLYGLFKFLLQHIPSKMRGKWQFRMFIGIWTISGTSYCRRASKQHTIQQPLTCTSGLRVLHILNVSWRSHVNRFCI